MAYEALVNAATGLPDEKVNELIDFAMFLKREPIRISQGVVHQDEDNLQRRRFEQQRSRNLILLSEIKEYQTAEDEDYVSDKVIDNTLSIVFHLIRQPEIFKTGRNSLHLQFELPDKSYMELEVFEDRITCMIVPQRVYKDVVYPDVSLGNMSQINKIVGEFYGAY